jgi:hypothetical protein
MAGDTSPDTSGLQVEKDVMLALFSTLASMNKANNETTVKAVEILSSTALTIAKMGFTADAAGRSERAVERIVGNG